MKAKAIVIFTFLLFFIPFLSADCQAIGLKAGHGASKLKLNKNFTAQNNFSNNKIKHVTSPKVQKLADEIILAMDLEENHTEWMHELCRERSERIEKIKLNGDIHQQKIIDLQAVNTDFENKIKANVSPAQFTKYQNYRNTSN